MTDADLMPEVRQLDGVGLRSLIAHAAGLLAHLTGNAAAVAVLRRIADRLEVKPS